MDESSGISLCLLEDENFLALMTHVSERALTWDDFLLQPQPAGIAAIHTWNSLNEFCRYLSSRSGVLDKDGCEYWCFYTREIALLIGEISALATKRSCAQNYLSAGYNHDLVIEMRAQEVFASLSLDSIKVSQHQIQKLLFSEIQPTDDLDTLIVNMASIDDGLDEFLDEPFSIELLRTLQLRLLDGVNTGSLPRSPFPLTADVSGNYHVYEIESDLDTVLDFANDPVCTHNESVYLRCTLLADLFRLNFQQRLAGACLSSLLSRLYLRKCSQHQMSFLPLSKHKLLWRNGKITPPEVSASLPEYYKTMDRGAGNITLHQTINAQLLVLLLTEITNRMERISSKDQDLKKTHKKHPEFNHRQVSILMRGLRSPHADFNISYHQNKHDISYATARRDLTQLAEAGFLVVERKGKSFFFRPSEHLEDLL